MREPIATIQRAAAVDIAMLIAFIIVSLILYQVLARIWGESSRIYLIVGLLAVYAVASLWAHLRMRRFQAMLDRLDENSRQALLRNNPAIAGYLSTLSLRGQLWSLLDLLCGCACALLPPITVSLLLGQPLSPDSEFTGTHLLAMAGGVGIYFLIRRYAIREWQSR